jgi:hypothetical protein
MRIEIVADSLLPSVVMIDWYDFLGRALQNRWRRRLWNGAHRVQLVEMTVGSNHEVLPETRRVFKGGHRISLGSTILLRLGTGVREHRTGLRKSNVCKNEHRKECEQKETDHGAPTVQSAGIREYRTRRYHRLELVSALGHFSDLSHQADAVGHCGCARQGPKMTQAV